MYWRVNRERILVLGAPAASLFQLAHPLVAAAVEEHTDFGRSASDRLRSTMRTTLAVVFGDEGEAAAAAGGVRDLHERIHGTLRPGEGTFADGTVYSASDPELLLWAHATIVRVGLNVYERFVRPLGPTNRDRYVAEAVRFAHAFGVTDRDVPDTDAALECYFDAVLQGPGLAVGERARHLAVGVLRPDMPLGLRPTLPAMRIVTAGLLPGRLREEFGLPWSRRHRAAFRAMAASSRASLPLLHPRARFWPEYRAAKRPAWA
jgi:uncharacterized protein (DUF2236 family)